MSAKRSMSKAAATTASAAAVEGPMAPTEVRQQIRKLFAANDDLRATVKGQAESIADLRETIVALDKEIDALREEVRQKFAAQANAVAAVPYLVSAVRGSAPTPAPAQTSDLGPSFTLTKTRTDRHFVYFTITAPHLRGQIAIAHDVAFGIEALSVKAILESR